MSFVYIAELSQKNYEIFINFDLEFTIEISAFMIYAITKFTETNKKQTKNFRKGAGIVMKNFSETKNFNAVSVSAPCTDTGSCCAKNAADAENGNIIIIMDTTIVVSIFIIVIEKLSALFYRKIPSKMKAVAV